MAKKILKFFFFNILLINGCANKPPDRVEGIPPDAVWHGGPDGGYWFKVIEKPDSLTFKFHLYDDVTGNLIDTGKYTVKGDCKESIGEIQDIQKVIDCYAGDRILLHLLNKKNCYLQRVRK